MILSIIYFLKFHKVEISIKVFEVNIFEIPNALFVLSFSSLLSIGYAAIRSADAEYYQKQMEIISSEVFKYGGLIFSRGLYNGGVILGNFLDVWKGIPSAGFRFTFIALGATSGVLIFLTSLLPFASAISYLSYITPWGSESAQSIQRIAMAVCLFSAMVAGIYALYANDLPTRDE